MKKETQDKIRKKVIERHLERAWECLLAYSYWGQKHETVEKQARECDERIAHFEGVIKDLRSGPDSHSKATRERVGAAQKDIDSYKNRLRSMEPLGKKLMEKAVGWQQQGVEYLELAEAAGEFKLNTPEEMEAAKASPAEPKS